MPDRFEIIILLARPRVYIIFPTPAQCAIVCYILIFIRMLVCLACRMLSYGYDVRT